MRATLNHTNITNTSQSVGTAPDATSAPPAIAVGAPMQDSGSATAHCFSSSTAQPELRREEWDFSQLAEKEVLNCWRWEFQREIYRSCENVRLAVDVLRKDRPLNAQRLHADLSNKKTALPWLADGFAHYPQSVWPETPYQAVDPEYRMLVFHAPKKQDIPHILATVGRVQDQPLEQRCLEEVVKAPESFGQWAHWPEGAVLDSGVWPLEITGSAVHREPIQNQSTVVAFSVDWSRTNTELKASFAQFLRANRSTGRVLANPEMRGRTRVEESLRAELKALGATRLQLHCGSVEKAMNLTQKSRPPITLYQNESDWSVAKQTSKAAMARAMESEPAYYNRILGIPLEIVFKRISFQHMGK